MLNVLTGCSRDFSLNSEKNYQCFLSNNRKKYEMKIYHKCF